MSAPPAVAVEGLGWSYGRRRALEGLHFALAPGEFAALLGPNGAGKSTLFALLTRLFAAREGRIAICGHDLARVPLRALACLGVVFQQPTLDLEVSARANLLYFAALQGLDGATARARAADVLARLGMAERAGERVRELNGGHRRRLEIARALMHRPRVLMLDEPTVGLDAGTRAAITDHVHRLAAEEGIAVLWATHLVDEVRPEDRVIVLHRGRILADAPAQALAPAGDLAAQFLAMTGEAA